jgi:dTDP-4-dehydrorhamnose 3,5-epimerase
MDSSEVLILGANGQLGKALQSVYPNARTADIDELDITDQASIKNYDWSPIKTILNAAGYTNVDGAETEEGRAAAWKVNNEAVGYLADAANEKNLLLVHISTAYVFDGKKKTYTEDDEPNPQGEYAKSKAAGDQKVKKTKKHYIVRTDSVIGEGKNFVRTMLDLGDKGVSPKVVADQIIRPTFTPVLAKAIYHLLSTNNHLPSTKYPFGIYNVTNDGDPISWAGFTREIFKEAGIDQKVIDTTYEEYSAGKPGVAPRPLNSVLDLTKIKAAGFNPTDWRQDLREYIKKELSA